jgi:hypothetical protein
MHNFQTSSSPISSFVILHLVILLILLIGVILRKQWLCKMKCWLQRCRTPRWSIDRSELSSATRKMWLRGSRKKYRYYCATLSSQLPPSTTLTIARRAFSSSRSTICFLSYTVRSNRSAHLSLCTPQFHPQPILSSSLILTCLCGGCLAGQRQSGLYVLQRGHSGLGQDLPALKVTHKPQCNLFTAPLPFR